MSWLFSQALVEASSVGTSSDGEPCAPLNVMPTPHKFWRNDKTIEPSQLSRFGLTCRVLTDDLGAALLTWCLGASRARTSASPARAPASRESDPACGPTWRGWLAKYDPDSSTWRTAQQSFIEDSGECLETFPRWGMTRGGLLWERPTLAPLTSAIDSGSLLPTPTAQSYGSCQGGSAGRDGQKNRPSLHTMAKAMGGQLNPEFVEWVMLWPIGWTALEPLGTVKSPCATPPPSESFQLHSTEATA